MWSLSIGWLSVVSRRERSRRIVREVVRIDRRGRYCGNGVEGLVAMGQGYVGAQNSYFLLGYWIHLAISHTQSSIHWQTRP